VNQQAALERLKEASELLADARQLQHAAIGQARLAGCTIDDIADAAATSRRSITRRLADLREVPAAAVLPVPVQRAGVAGVTA